MSQAGKILKITEIFTSLEDDNELRRLLNDIPTLVYKKFKIFNCKQTKPNWGGTYDTVIQIPFEVKIPTAEKLYQFRVEVGKELVKSFKSKFKIRKSADYLMISIPFSSQLPLIEIYSSSSFVNLRVSDDIFIIKIVTHPDEIIEFNRKYDTTTQLEQLKLYLEKLLEACDILVKTVRLLDFENLK